jgi:hypothetical protein
VVERWRYKVDCAVRAAAEEIHEQVESSPGRILAMEDEYRDGRAARVSRAP